jgi:hypothetical protein
VRRRLAAVLLCALAGPVLIGCGNQRSKPPDLVSPQRPTKFRRLNYAEAQVRVSAPDNWSQNPGPLPLVAVVISGRASVAIWRYPRAEPLPRTAVALKDARAALADAARTQDPKLRILSSRAVSIHGVPGIELLADETIAGQRRRVRSTHLFGRGAEYVLDAYAPSKVFKRVDRTVFAPLVASVRLGRTRPGAR